MAEKEIKDHSLILPNLTGEKGISFEMGKLTDDQDSRGKFMETAVHLSMLVICARQLTGKRQWSVSAEKRLGWNYI